MDTKTDRFTILAAELDRRGIDRCGRMPDGAVAEIADALGYSVKSIQNATSRLRKAGGDPTLAVKAQALCAAKQASARRQRYQEDPAFHKRLDEYGETWRRKTPAAYAINQARNRARQREVTFDLTRKQVEDLFAPMVCSVTGLPLTMNRPGFTGEFLVL